MDSVLIMVLEWLPKVLEREERFWRLVKNFSKKPNVSRLAHDLKTARVRDKNHWADATSARAATGERRICSAQCR